MSWEVLIYGKTYGLFGGTSLEACEQAVYQAGLEDFDSVPCQARLEKGEWEQGYRTRKY